MVMEEISARFLHFYSYDFESNLFKAGYDLTYDPATNCIRFEDYECSFCVHGA